MATTSYPYPRVSRPLVYRTMALLPCGDCKPLRNVFDLIRLYLGCIETPSMSTLLVATHERFHLPAIQLLVNSGTCHITPCFIPRNQQSESGFRLRCTFQRNFLPCSLAISARACHVDGRCGKDVSSSQSRTQ